MRRVIGFGLFFCGIGMLISLFMCNLFLTICIILALLIVGFNMFANTKCK